MFADNPFLGVAAGVSSAVLQGFVLVMAAFVLGGTLFDMWHQGSARYFFENRRAAEKTRTREISPTETLSIGLRSAIVDGLGSGEFCNGRRRLAHLLTMYGFLLYVGTTIALVFFYPTAETPAPAIVAELWHIGALLICVGGYWFWFFIRVDVVAEGNSPFRVVRADLFVLSLLANATLALVWSWLESQQGAWANVCLGLYLLSAVVLFGSVPWSKFSHMFYKPAAAIGKRLDDANGSRSNLPLPADQPTRFGSARRPPRNY